MLNIIFEAQGNKFDLELRAPITQIDGLSGTGKTYMFELLRNTRVSGGYEDIGISRDKMMFFDYNSSAWDLNRIRDCTDSIICIDNANYLLAKYDWLLELIFSKMDNNYFLVAARGRLGLQYPLLQRVQLKYEKDCRRFSFTRE